MFAVIEAGGAQHRVSAGDVIQVQKLGAAAGSEISIDTVLLVADGDRTSVGAPYVSGARVRAEVQEEKKAPKVLIFKKKPRKGHKKLRGHRQHYTVLKIRDIEFGG